MKIYALFDTAGRVAGFWTDDLYPPNEDGGINPAILADVVEISAEAHARLVEFPDAWRWQNGALVAYEAPPLTPEEARQRCGPHRQTVPSGAAQRRYRAIGRYSDNRRHAGRP